MNVVGLFAGIGGLEVGLKRAGHSAARFSENDVAAGRVLEERFPGVENDGDVRNLGEIPASTELLTAGFPCQDLSQAGRTNGIAGRKSGIVTHMLSLLEQAAEKGAPVPRVLVENVPFMLHLDGGRAIQYLVDRLEAIGYSWAYRVVDSRAFGLPQRRQRVFLLASLVDDPAPALLNQDAGELRETYHEGVACGFYWTEGNRGLGWAVDAVPTLKGGSTIGIPSPPAIWLPPENLIVTPDIRDAERLQGFDEDWTLPAESVDGVRPSYRWKLVGNAVSVPAAEWIGGRIEHAEPKLTARIKDGPIRSKWPRAACGSRERGRFEAMVSMWPRQEERVPLASFLKYEPKPLSHRATTGFLKRLQSSSLRYPTRFEEALMDHESRMRQVA